MVLAIAGVCAWAIPQPSQAQCVPTTPMSGDTVVCSPNQDGNYAVSNLNSLTVQILPGASINGTFVATGIGTLTFLNSGNTNGLVTLNTTTSLVFQNSGVINQGLMITAAGTRLDHQRCRPHHQRHFPDLRRWCSQHHEWRDAQQRHPADGQWIQPRGQPCGSDRQHGIRSTGTSVDTVDNSGTIQGGTFDLGAGNDIVISRAGVINSDVNTGAGDDTLTMLGGLLRRVNAGSGNDTATIEGGQIDDRYSGQDGDDQLTWTGGRVRNIDMGNGTDTALLKGLPSSSLDFGELTSVSGGQGPNDRLTFEGTDAFGPSRFTLWERVDLTNNSSLTLGGGALVLGDSGTSTGTMSINSSSILFAGGGQNGAALQFRFARDRDECRNHRSTNGGVNATDSLRIKGNYALSSIRGSSADLVSHRSRL